jgi:putative alpha-1,2-mannosidase
MHVRVCSSNDAVHRYPLQNKYLEGDAVQWKWFVPQDPAGLRALFPDNDTFVADLEQLMNKVCVCVGAFSYIYVCEGACVRACVRMCD